MLLRNLALTPLVLALSIGCSGGDSPAPQTKSSAGATAKPGGDNPIATAAYDFMDAVFANDIARASQRLTPQAMQNMQAQDQRFEWGAEAAKLEIGEVREQPGGEAIVQCFVKQTKDANESPAELLCVLRQVGAEWLVYGVAWAGAGGSQPQVVNFEDAPATPDAGTAPPAGGERYADYPVPQIPPAEGGAQPLPRTAAGLPSGYVE